MRAHSGCDLPTVGTLDPETTELGYSRDTPFFLRPYIQLRGVPAVRYQGDQVASFEPEVGWQCSARWATPGFVREAQRKVLPMYLPTIAVLIFVGLLACLEIGFRAGAKRVKNIPNAFDGFGAIEGAVFGIFGLLLSLSFFGAASRLDARRQLIVNEANAIASAYTRVDLLPDAEQPQVRRLFREYLNERIRISESADEAQALAEKPQATKLQQAIWSPRHCSAA